MEVTPRVEEVRAVDNTHIYLKFVDGKEKIYDMSKLIEKNQSVEITGLESVVKIWEAKIKNPIF